MRGLTQLAGVLILLGAATLVVVEVQADVTGSFGTHIAVIPQTTASEVSLIDFDIQNELNVTLVISGLSATLHSHFGIAGVEDLIVSTHSTLGSLDISSDVVFGRFLGSCFPFSVFFNSCLTESNIFNEVLPISDSLLFVKKRVEASIHIGGIAIRNLSIFEDVNFRSGDPLAGQTQDFAFGDVITLTGATPSGISLMFQSGICAEKNANVIKKHYFPYRVNEDCATEPKPDFLFDFEMIQIEGIPIAPNVTAGAIINCLTILGCDLFVDISFAGGPIPFSTFLSFTDLLSLSFGGAQLIFQSGGGTMTLSISPLGIFSSISIAINATLNPDRNPATLILRATAVPGMGLIEAGIDLVIQRSNLSLLISADFAGGPPAEFEDITFGLRVPSSLIDLESTATFDRAGLVRADFWLTVKF